MRGPQRTLLDLLIGEGLEKQLFFVVWARPAVLGQLAIAFPLVGAIEASGQSFCPTSTKIWTMALESRQSHPCYHRGPR